MLQISHPPLGPRCSRSLDSSSQPRDREVSDGVQRVEVVRSDFSDL